MIQNIIALSIVAIAGGYLAWRLRRFFALAFCRRPSLASLQS